MQIIHALFNGLLLIPSASAQVRPLTDPCAFVGGCDPTRGQRIIFNAMQELGSFFVAGASGVTMVMVVFGGMMMLLSFGDESKVTKGKNAVIFALIGYAGVLAAQVVVGFVVSRLLVSGVQRMEYAGIQLMRLLVTTTLHVFNTVFAMVVIFAGFRMMMSHGKQDEFNKAKNMLIWSIVGAIVINVAHALVRGIFLTGFGGVTG